MTKAKAKAATQKVGAPSPKSGVGVAPSADAPKAQQAAGDQVDFSTKEFPLTLVATNNSPIPVYLNEAGVMLAANFFAPDNTRTVTFPTADHLAREIANVEAIAIAHSFEDVLQLSEVGEEAQPKETETPTGDDTGSGEAKTDGAATEQAQ